MIKMMDTLYIYSTSKTIYRTVIQGSTELIQNMYCHGKCDIEDSVRFAIS